MPFLWYFPAFVLFQIRNLYAVSVSWRPAGCLFVLSIAVALMMCVKFQHISYRTSQFNNSIYFYFLHFSNEDSEASLQFFLAVDIGIQTDRTKQNNISPHFNSYKHWKKKKKNSLKFLIEFNTPVIKYLNRPVRCYTFSICPKKSNIVKNISSISDNRWLTLLIVLEILFLPAIWTLLD